MTVESSYYVVIPARFASSRYPGKPLIDIAGKTLLERVYLRCLAAFEASRIFVATDDLRIKEYCESKKFNVAMTSSSCLTGTDRVAEFAETYPADFYINVQGDEPLVFREDLLAVLVEAQKDPSKIVNGMCPIRKEEHFFSVNVPKVVTTPDGKLLYMSRAGIPSNKKKSFAFGMRQVCIYSFPKKALLEFAKCEKKTPLESEEDIEILRFLELGHEVKMIHLSENSFAVDVPEDVDIVLNELRRRGES